MKAPLLVASAGVALAAPGHSRNSAILRRTGYDLCENDCNLAGVAFPDKHTLQLPLEHNWSEQCPPIAIGDPSAPTATSRVCLDFVGTNVYFNFSSFSGYTYKNAAVTWKLKGNVLTPDAWTSPPPTNTVACTANPSGDGLFCRLPFSDILAVSPSTSTKDLLSGMCPNGDREGLVLYLSFTGEATSTSNPSITLPFAQLPPCTTRDSSGQCTARDTTYSYIETAYRCSNCGVAACPSEPTTSSSPSSPSTSSPPESSTSSLTSSSPTPSACAVGTAFGYQAPVGAVQKSTPLNTQSGQGCNRWGWYTTPTLSELQSGSGVSGPLYVGAGRNDISKATDVGTWTAKADAAGNVVVTYALRASYGLDEVHVDLACLPIDKCAPGSYTFGKSGLGDVAQYSTPALSYPSCKGGSKAALIVHAAVDQSGFGACPAVVV
ncbi:hypothetical protein VTI74DRAFT_2242 [Chaetomium olivicolor]